MSFSANAKFGPMFLAKMAATPLPEGNQIRVSSEVQMQGNFDWSMLSIFWFLNDQRHVGTIFKQFHFLQIGPLTENTTTFSKLNVLFLSCYYTITYMIVTICRSAYVLSEHTFRRKGIRPSRKRGLESSACSGSSCRPAAPTAKGVRREKG